ncbi:MAG: hypothetical protein M0T70_02950 [Geobacteraceae bacterium]|nr:hypothetical protein [Geobacteraceae bacterium]
MAKDVTYTYSGPLSGVTLEDGREVMLHPGAEVPLPADNPYVKALVAQQLLTEAVANPVKEEIHPAPPVQKGGKTNKEVTSDVS